MSFGSENMTKRIYTTFFLVLVVVCSWGCSALGDCACSEADLAVVDAPTLPFEVRSPKGGEIDVTVKMVKPHVAKVTVRNVSTEPVFIPYAPMVRNGLAFVAILGLERLDRATGEFRSAEEGHLGPGINALPAGETFEYQYSLENGTYRLNVRYSVDERDAELRNGLHGLTGEEFAQRVRVLEAMMPISVRSHFSATFKS